MRAIVFDFDDTLSDWVAQIDRAIERSFAGESVYRREQLRGRLWSAIDRFAFVERDGIIVNRGFWKLLYGAAPVWRDAFPELDAPVVEHQAETFRRNLQPIPFPEVAEVITTLAGSYRLAMLTNSPVAEAGLRDFGLRHHFEHFLAADDPYRKPHPQPFLEICRRLGIEPSEGLYVGDSIESDVEGALAAGMVPVWVDRFHDRVSLPEAVHCIDTLVELPGLLQRLA